MEALVAISLAGYFEGASERRGHQRLAIVCRFFLFFFFSFLEKESKSEKWKFSVHIVYCISLSYAVLEKAGGRKYSKRYVLLLFRNKGWQRILGKWKNEFALLFRDCETNKSTVEEIKETGGLGRKVMSIMVMILIVSINLMLMVMAMVMVIFMVMILIVSMVMLAARSCLGIPVRRESARWGGGDGEVRQSWEAKDTMKKVESYVKLMSKCLYEIWIF